MGMYQLIKINNIVDIFYEILGCVWLFLYPASVMTSIGVVVYSTLKKKLLEGQKLIVFSAKYICCK